MKVLIGICTLFFLLLNVFATAQTQSNNSIGFNISPAAGLVSESELWHKYGIHLIREKDSGFDKKYSLSYNRSVEPDFMNNELIHDTDSCRVFRSVRSTSKNFDFRFGLIHKVNNRIKLGVNALLGYSSQTISHSDVAESYNTSSSSWEIDYVKAYEYNNKPFESSQSDYAFLATLGRSNYLRLGLKPDIILVQPITERLKLNLTYSPEVVTYLLLNDNTSVPYQGKYKQPHSYVRFSHFLDLYINYTL